MNRIHIDIETYSPVPIAAGVYRYSEHPDFRILMAGWSLNGGPITVAVGQEEIAGIPRADMSIAHNAQFERICFSRFAGMPVGQYLDPAGWHCTMAVAGERGYPQQLGKLAAALGAEPKDTAGSALIRRFCVPNRRGLRNLPEDFPEEWAAFTEYCRQDVATLKGVDLALGSFPTRSERQVYLTDQRINDRGMAIDVEMARRAVSAAEDNRMVQEVEFMSITGLANPGSNPQVLGWLQNAGLAVEDLQAATVVGLLAGELDPPVRRVLELRQELALVAAKKYGAAITAVSLDGRLRGGFRFFGAHTGRWAGRGVQPHNLPRASLPGEAEAEAAIVDLKLGLGADAHTLKALVRALFVGPFTVVDYGSIEARVIAWFGEEEWALDAFRAGRDIYVETAERMGGLTRAQGKVAVLALGFAGGTGSLRVMGAKGTDMQLQYLVDQWRRANPAIVSLWSTMERAFRIGGPVGPHLRVIVTGDDREIRLPSGRGISYHAVRWVKDRASFSDPKTGVRVDTYGGRLVENAVQAVARDVLAEALVRLQDRGYDVVAHVHDEALVQGTDAVSDVVDIMCEPPAWADGLPLAAAGHTCARYRKAD